MKIIPLLIIIPLIEIFLFISVSNYIGVFYVLLITLLTAFFGLLLVRKNWMEKLQVIKGESIGNSRTVLDNLSDSLFILVSGVFFITPGFMTDLLGILLMNSKIRNFFRIIVINRLIGSYDLKKTEKKFTADYEDVDYDEIND